MSAGTSTGNGLTHLDGRGQARMVDVTGKEPTRREARARCRLALAPDTADRLRSGDLGGGDALSMAKVAGMFAAKRTSSLVPLCHTILLDDVRVELTVGPAQVDIEATVTAWDRTGVEIEALGACLVAALTLYDVCRHEDRTATIEDAVVLEKSGGRSGSWHRLQDGSIDHRPERAAVDHRQRLSPS